MEKGAHYSAKPDGELHPVMGGIGEKAAFSKGGKGKWVYPDGMVFEYQTEIAADGKSVTFTGKTTDKDGKTMDAKTVYNRVK